MLFIAIFHEIMILCKHDNSKLAINIECLKSRNFAYKAIAVIFHWKTNYAKLGKMN